jgi:hypothetical protein
MPPKTYVYIDGFNLYNGAVKHTTYKGLNLLKLCQQMLPSDNIDTVKFFTAALSGRPTDPDQPIRQQIYWRALRTIPNLSIILGQFTTHSKSMPITGCHPIQWLKVDRTDEKGTDVNLASHLLHDGFLRLFDVAVVISNDSDLREPVRMVREVLGKPVGVLNPHKTHSQELQEYATFKKRIRASDLAVSQFPDTLSDSHGIFRKPHAW